MADMNLLQTPCRHDADLSLAPQSDCWRCQRPGALPWHAARDFAATAPADFVLTLCRRGTASQTTLCAAAIHAAQFDAVAKQSGLTAVAQPPAPAIPPIPAARQLRLPAVLWNRRRNGPPTLADRLARLNCTEWDLRLHCTPKAGPALQWDGYVLTTPHASAARISHLFIGVTRDDGALTPKEWADLATTL